MRNMAFAILFSSFIVALALPLQAQDVELVLSDNQSVRGTLEGFQEGKYRINVDGEIRVIPEDDVITLTIVSRRDRPTSEL